jgi:hypothetical protein
VVFVTGQLSDYGRGDWGRKGSSESYASVCRPRAVKILYIDLPSEALFRPTPDACAILKSSVFVHVPEPRDARPELAGRKQSEARLALDLAVKGELCPVLQARPLLLRRSTRNRLRLEG